MAPKGFEPSTPRFLKKFPVSFVIFLGGNSENHRSAFEEIQKEPAVLFKSLVL